MNKVRALVLGVGGNVSQGIIKALRQTKYNIEVVGACVSKKSVGLYMCDTAYLCPYAEDPDFISWYIDLCNREHIDIVFTGVEENIDVLLKNRSYIEQNCKAKFLFPDARSWEIGADKYLTCEWLKENGCHYPLYADMDHKDAVYDLTKICAYPFIAKPKKGKSSKGVYLIKDKSELLSLPSLSDYVLEECVGTDDDEYTVGCYCDKNGNLRGHIILKRFLKSGTTSICTVVQNQLIDDEVEKICSRLKPVGPINFQMRIDGSRVVCFEMNVRYSGTTAIRNHFGFKDVEAGLKEYLLDEDISDCFRYTFGSALRFDDEMYFDMPLNDLYKMISE